MHLLNLSFREMAEINNDLQVSTETIVKRIIVEKEGRGLSNTDVADLLNKIGSTYSDNRITLGETIRKALYAKNPDKVLLEDLCKALNIPAITQEELILSRHYHVNKNREVKPGCISDDQKRANKELYKESQKYVNSVDEGVSIEEMVNNGMESEDYAELKEIKIEEETLAKLTIIFRKYPREVREFTQRFEFNKEDIEELKKCHVKVTYR